MTDYPPDLDFLAALPRRLVFGAGTVAEVPAELAHHGASRALLVTDRNIRSAGLADSLLGDSRVVTVFDDVEPDSSIEAVEAAAAVGKLESVDSVVSLAGGSVIDTAKMASVLLSHGGSLREYSGFQMLEHDTAPHIAVPTTAGTGSEVTYAAVIRDSAQQSKLLYADHKLIPSTAVLDPALTVGMPTALTVATGFDTLSHCIEAVCSQQRQPLADVLAYGALERVMRSLPRCVEVPDDLVARGEMLLAASLAGIAFSNAQVGLVHALSHPAGARWRVAHGTLNGIFLPHVMRFNADDAAKPLAEISRRMDADGSVEGAAVAVESLADTVGQPRRLRDVGIDREGLPWLAEAALSDGSIIYNARMVLSADELMPLLEAAW